MNSHSNSPRTVLTDFTCTAFTLPVSWSALVVCSLSRWIEAKALSSGLTRWHCFSVMQQCDTKSVFSASCPFFLTLHWSIHSDMSEAWCPAALFGFLSNTIRLEWRWRLRCLHIQSKICLILLHRPLQMRAFCTHLQWPANRLLLHCWAQHTVAHMPLKTTSRVFWTKRNLLILMSQQDTAKWTTAVGW